jgi:MarR family transcriptional regulator, transcriptional regulator for hemolysin
MVPHTKFSFHDSFGYQLVSLAHRWRHVMELELERHGLAPTTWRPLLHVAMRERPPCQRDLAESMQIGGPALVRILDNLEAKGLVERVDVDDDRRLKHVRLTPAGQRIAALAHEVMVDLERQIVEGLEPHELAAASLAFQAIGQRLSSFETDGSASISSRVS